MTNAIQPEPAEHEVHPSDQIITDTKRLKITWASQITPRRQRWLWAPEGQGVIPLGTATILAGAGGVGKTSFALHVVAMGTRGELPGDLHGQHLNAIIFGPEDDWATVHTPRLVAAGADLDRIAKIIVETETPTFTSEREMKFPLDMTLFREAIEKTDAKIVILDPAPSLMGGDMNKVQDVRTSFEPLLAYAQKMDLAVIFITHFNKGAGASSNKVSGSHGWRDLTRSLLVFALDDESGECIMTQDKNNYGPSRASYRLAMETVDVHTPDGITSVGRTVVLGESDLTVDQIINRPIETEGEDGEDRNEAEAFVYDFLKNTEAGEAKAQAVIKAGHAAGFSENQIKNARKRCKNPRILSVKSAMGSGWVWQLDTSPEGVKNTPGIPEGVEGVKTSRRDPFVIPSETGGEGVTKVSSHHSVTPSTPSQIPLTPSGESSEEKEAGVTPSQNKPRSPLCSREFCERPAAQGSEKCQYHLGLAARMDELRPGWDSAA